MVVNAHASTEIAELQVLPRQSARLGELPCVPPRQIADDSCGTDPTGEDYAQGGRYGEPKPGVFLILLCVSLQHGGTVTL